MKLITYLHPRNENEQLAILVNEKAYDTHQLDNKLPDNMNDFLWGEDETMALAKAYDAKIKAGETVNAKPKRLDQLQLLPPLSQPNSWRNIHHATPQQVAYQFLNHNAVQASGTVACMPDHLKKLDVNVGVAAVIGWNGYNLRTNEADDFIAGFILCSVWVARAFGQKASVQGSDFCISTAPIFVTPDEVPHEDTEAGKQYFFDVSLQINGKKILHSHTKELSYTFAELLTQCAYGTELFPGDVVSICPINEVNLWHINQQKKEKRQHIWLHLEDKMRINEATLGQIKHRIIRSDDRFSII